MFVTIVQLIISLYNSDMTLIFYVINFIDGFA